MEQIAANGFKPVAKVEILSNHPGT
jgi:hypothetical protein